jgi:hypothetical protein
MRAEDDADVEVGVRPTGVVAEFPVHLQSAVIVGVCLVVLPQLRARMSRAALGVGLAGRPAGRRLPARPAW